MSCARFVILRSPAGATKNLILKARSFASLRMTNKKLAHTVNKLTYLLTIHFLFLFFTSTTNLHADTAFLRQLADQPVAHLSDAVSVMTQFLNPETQSSDFESQKALLEQQGLLSKRLAERKADAIIRRGDLAEIAVKVAGARGGLMFQLVRPWRESLIGHYLFQKYALKEAIFLKLIKEDDIRSIVSGIELISTFSQIAEYQSGE